MAALEDQTTSAAWRTSAAMEDQRWRTNGSAGADGEEGEEGEHRVSESRWHRCRAARRSAGRSRKASRWPTSQLSSTTASLAAASICAGRSTDGQLGKITDTPLQTPPPASSRNSTKPHHVGGRAEGPGQACCRQLRLSMAPTTLPTTRESSYMYITCTTKDLMAWTCLRGGGGGQGRAEGGGGRRRGQGRLGVGFRAPGML